MIFQAVKAFLKMLVVTSKGDRQFFFAGAVSLCYYLRTSSAVPFGKDASVAVGKDPRNTGPGSRRSLASPPALIALLRAGGLT